MTTRSGDVFLRLHEISKRNPDLRPGQTLESISDGTDTFYWEARAWLGEIDQAFPPKPTTQANAFPDDYPVF